MAPEESLIPLASVISDLRRELSEAIREGQGQELRFSLKPIELEISVAVTKSHDADGKVKFWVLEFGGQASFERAGTQKLTIVLEPILSDGRKVLVSKSDSSRPGA